MTEWIFIIGVAWLIYLDEKVWRKLKELEWLITDTRAEVRRRKDDKG